ncbi:MAG: hypothetical protein E6387_00825 [Veillonella sp.]|jgi:hypothetical protein|uniref:hypothetical protein n=1 Tax=Veillonella sp. TaxID=1926307 RepID=UPI0020564054|nr:hypothetical protein [Veillonella sp.]MDU4115989.1 hypothetical protein [Veillonella sp.]MDU6902552.1 hypothetical protein [Veillonella sp.]DAT79071.1 MAG TPA: hypothetical protein [Caudoviricetes sp.]
MEWRLNKKQIAEVTAMFTELCEKIADKEISLNLGVRKNDTENGEVIFTYDVYAIYKGKLIYINMGSYRSLMDSPITNVDVEGIITLLKGDK